MRKVSTVFLEWEALIWRDSVYLQSSAQTSIYKYTYV